jgi:hypothetical protein
MVVVKKPVIEKFPVAVCRPEEFFSTLYRDGTTSYPLFARWLWIA